MKLNFAPEGIHQACNWKFEPDNGIRAGHFILQVSEHFGGANKQAPLLEQAREIPLEALQAGPPKFDLAGLAVGDGLTHPELQVITSFWPMGDARSSSLACS